MNFQQILVFALDDLKVPKITPKLIFNLTESLKMLLKSISNENTAFPAFFR